MKFFAGAEVTRLIPAKLGRVFKMVRAWNGRLGPVEPVALRLVLPAQRAPAAGPFTVDIRPIPSSDAALGDGHGRSAARATFSKKLRAMILKTRPRDSLRRLLQNKDEFACAPIANRKS
jgi:hypothetical protein